MLALRYLSVVIEGSQVTRNRDAVSYPVEQFNLSMPSKKPFQLSPIIVMPQLTETTETCPATVLNLAHTGRA